MTPCILLSDLHVDDYKPFSSNRDRLEDCLLVLDDVYKIAKKKGAKIILFTGDFFNSPRFLYTKVINRTIARMQKLISENPEVVWFAITGNHDFATKNLPHKPAVSAIEYLATAFPINFIIVDNIWILGKGENPTYGVMGIPNYEFKEHFQKQLLDMSVTAAGYKIRHPNLKVTLMIHQSPEGQYNQNVRTQTSPSDPLYKDFDLVVCGDIHTSQRITDTFLLPGNPLHRELTDEGKDKGIWSLDLEDPANTLKFISRKGRYPEFKRAKKGVPIVDDADNFIIQAPDVPMLSDEGAIATLAKFGSSLPKDELLTNFFNEVTDGHDKELLKMGLSFLS